MSMFAANWPRCEYPMWIVGHMAVIRFDQLSLTVPLHVAISGRLYTSEGRCSDARDPNGYGSRAAQSGRRVAPPVIRPEGPCLAQRVAPRTVMSFQPSFSST